MLKQQLKEADRSRVTKGWRHDGFRERLDAFAERGLESVLSNTLPKDVQPGLIIGDVGMFFLSWMPFLPLFWTQDPLCKQWLLRLAISTDRAIL